MPLIATTRETEPSLGSEHWTQEAKANLAVAGSALVAERVDNYLFGRHNLWRSVEVLVRKWTRKVVDRSSEIEPTSALGKRRKVSVRFESEVPVRCDGPE